MENYLYGRAGCNDAIPRLKHYKLYPGIEHLLLLMAVFIADKIFDGRSWKDLAIVTENGFVKDLADINSVDKSQAQNFPGCFLVPAFIDLQIYGAYGKLLAVYPEPASLAALNDYCRKGGAAWFLPTVATNTIDVFHKCIDAVKLYQQQGGAGVLGLHLEGPWINPAKKGAHVESCIHSPSIQEVKELLEYGKGVIRMITLAPEVCSQEVTDLVTSHNIIISAGHSNATYREAISAFDHGVSAATHLYNAMSPLQHRAPGVVGACFMHDRVKASIIADGYHVDFEAIRIAKEIMKERLFVITDAVTETSEGYYRHALVNAGPDEDSGRGDRYECNGTLSGSALTMHQSFLNLINKVGIDAEEALRMCSLYPAEVLKCDDLYGKIAPGLAAQFLVVNHEYEMIDLVNG
jgi:N-acetylglucosamine-6-phosphate deacetylase